MGDPETVYCERCLERSSLAGSSLCASCVEYERLLAEELTACPVKLTSDDFQRFMRKVAVHAHATRPPDALGVTLLQMELSLTEVVLQNIPNYYVSVFEYDPEDQLEQRVKGSYTFKAAIPQDVLYRAMEKTQIWRRYDPEDPDNFAGA